MLDLEMLLEIAVDEVDSGESQADTSTETNGQVVTENEENKDITEASDNETPYFELDGEKLTAEQIKEYRQGYFRQSDYTRKTQEIANQRKENQEAIELYEYFKANPHLAQKLAEIDENKSDVTKKMSTLDPAVQELQLKIKTMEIDNEINSLKAIDKDFNEVEVLNLATKKAMPIKDAYALWKGMNFDKLLNERLAKQSSELTETIKKNNSSTKTLMNPADTSANADGLTEAEIVMAEKLGMTREEYKKWK